MCNCNSTSDNLTSNTHHGSLNILTFKPRYLLEPFTLMEQQAGSLAIPHINATPTNGILDEQYSLEASGLEPLALGIPQSRDCSKSSND
jgi:hypothetical protein